MQFCTGENALREWQITSFTVSSLQGIIFERSWEEWGQNDKIGGKIHVPSQSCHYTEGFRFHGVLWLDFYWEPKFRSIIFLALQQFGTILSIFDLTKTAIWGTRLFLFVQAHQATSSKALIFQNQQIISQYDWDKSVLFSIWQYAIKLKSQKRQKGCGVAGRYKQCHKAQFYYLTLWDFRLQFRNIWSTHGLKIYLICVGGALLEESGASPAHSKSEKIWAFLVMIGGLEGLETLNSNENAAHWVDSLQKK